MGFALLKTLPHFHFVSGFTMGNSLVVKKLKDVNQIGSRATTNSHINS